MSRYANASWAATCVLFLLSLNSQVLATEDDVLAAMEAFIEAFENGDLETMEAAFSPNAVTFPRAIMAYEYDGEIDVAKYRRVSGIDPQMREIVNRLKKSGRDSPYLDINPVDLDIKVFGTAALVTFHLGGGESIGRRTFVLELIDDAWKIVHLHASNVSEARE